MRGVLLHGFVFLIGEGAGLVQHCVCNGDLAHIVQRRRKVEPRNGIGVQFVPVLGQLRNIDGQRLHVVLRTFDVRAGFRIAPFRKACHGVNGGFLREGKLARAGEHQIVQVVAVEFVFELVGNAIAHQRGAERLGYVILRAQRKALGFVSFFILRRNEHNRDVAGLRIASDIAYCHHERWDGKGYPRGIAGKDIPLSARLMSVADVYDALRSKRVYKPAMPHETAMRIILEGRGTQFDPEVVDAFLAMQEQFRSIAAKYSDM